MGSGRRALAVALYAVAFGTNVATPLFLIYDERLDLSRWTVTALFAIYPIGLAPALAYAGPASDVFGRRVVVVPGLVLSGVASLLMLLGDDTLWLFLVGRFLLGAAASSVAAVQPDLGIAVSAAAAGAVARELLHALTRIDFAGIDIAV